MSLSRSNKKSSLRYVLVMLSLSIAVFSIAPYHNSHAFPITCNKDLSPTTSRNSNISTPGVTSFAFNYSKSGGLGSTHDTICYSSNDGLLVKTHNKSSTKVQLSKLDAINLQQIISKSVPNLNTYRPTPGSADYHNYTLTVLLNGSRYRGSWTDASTGVPTELVQVRKEIESAAADP
jgi:hypothetical protein